MLKLDKNATMGKFHVEICRDAGRGGTSVGWLSPDPISMSAKPGFHLPNPALRIQG